MEELIFFAVIIFFSIAESIARKKKAGRTEGSGGASRPDPSEPLEQQFEWTNNPPDLPTYDEDPSYDEGPSYDEQLSYDERGEGSLQPRHAAPRETSRSSSADTMLPGGLLEELAGLAGKFEAEQERVRRSEVQRERARTVKTPKQSPPLPAPTRTSSSRTRVPEPPRSRTPRSKVVDRSAGRQGSEHPVHEAHAGYGTDPSERARSEQDGLDPLNWELSKDARAVRAQLLSHGDSGLRQAVILQEVLGPPVSMRDDD
ncbi:MAG: hypothetical protein OSA81_10150 [Longimicrobiales bacterium]|nr:hypothetical protein [Longimicrobiales bacterium]